MSSPKSPANRRGTVTRLGENYQLRFERHIPHSRQRIWEAIATETGLSLWFPAEASWESFEVGSRIDFAFPPEANTGGAPCPPGMITAIDRPHTFAFLWGTELMRFELLEEVGGTLLVFTHHINATEKPDAAKFAAGWQVCFEVLDHHLSGSKPPPADRWQVAYAVYTDDFAKNF